MYDWFECKVRYERPDDEGAVKKIQASYLVDAMSFTEAEKRITLELQTTTKGEIEIADIRRLRISELIELHPSDADIWFRCRLVFTFLDEKSKKEKRATSQVFVRATSIRRAIASIEETFKGTLDYTIALIAETSIVQVFHYAEIHTHK